MKWTALSQLYPFISVTISAILGARGWSLPATVTAILVGYVATVAILSALV